MTDLERLHSMRELFLSASESDSARLIAVIGSVGLALLVLQLVRRRALREEYTPIWMGAAACLLLISLRMDLLLALTRAIGAWTASSTIFFLGLVFLVLICLNFAVRLSRATGQIRTLGQEVALLRAALGESRPGPRGAGEAAR